MRIKITIIVVVSISIILFCVSKVGDKYKDGVLYNQSELRGYEEKENQSSYKLINRSKAIKIAKHILRDVLDIDMKDGKPTMYVDIYINDDKDETYNWNIWWSKENFLGNYSVELNSVTGEILNIYVNDDFPIKNNQISSELTRDKILSIIKPFTNELEINLNNYTLKISSIVDYNIKGIKTPYKYCLFENNDERFAIMIDSRAEKITMYTKNPSQEV